ncbi:MAG: ABC transporter permease [Planctomycetota bacterium]|jgi:ABC-type lipoprotein release transport system permease subunit
MQTTTIQIAWRNLGRNIRRTALAILAITVGQFALLATDSLMRGYADNIRLAITGPMIGHVQAHAAEWRQERAIDLVIEDAESIVTQIQADPTVMNATARIYAPVLFAPEQDAFVAMVVGLQSNIESHEWGLLSGMTEPLQKGKVLIGHRLARKTGAKIGQEIAVVGQAADGSLANDLYVIQDIIKCPVDMVNQSGVVMSLEDAQQLLYMPNAAHEIVVRTNQSGQEKQLVERLQQMEGLNEAEVMSWQELVPELVVILNTSDWVGYFVIVIVCIAALAGIANTLVMSTFERMHEFGMLLALGSRPRRIVRMIMYEAILTGLLGVAAGTLLGYLFVWMTSSTGIDMASWGGSGGEVADMAYKGLNLPLHIYPRLEIFDALLGLVAILATSLVGSIWPAWIAGRLEPMEAMRA